MPLPNFLIIGAQKAGTSWLARNLALHPDIFMPRKEIHFFDRKANFRQGIDWYEQHFSNANEKQLIGEKTPDYLWVRPDFPNLHRLIYEMLPNAKLIVVLRNPVDRAISHLNHLIRGGAVSPLYNMDELLAKDAILDRGNYYRQIKAYYDYFDPSQILILINEEDIARFPEIGLKKVCEFLGIDSTFEFHFQNRKIHEHRNSKWGMVLGYYLPVLRPIISRLDRYSPLPAYKFHPSESMIRQLYEVYAPENEKLFDLLGRRLASWEMPTFMGNANLLNANLLVDV